MFCLGVTRGCLSFDHHDAPILITTKPSTTLATSMVSARSRIPIEIWQHIFRLYCLQCDLRLTEQDTQDSGPWLLSYVCHLWRAIVLTTPSLWSRLSVKKDGILEKQDEEDYDDPEVRSDEYIEAVEERLECQLLRSKPLPLDIFCEGWLDNDYIEEALAPLYYLLIEHSDRWQDLRLSDISYFFYESFCDVVEEEEWSTKRRKNPFPLLRSLEFSVCHLEVYRVFCSPAPNLRKIAMSANHDTLSLIKELPLSQITHCELWQFHSSFTTKILARVRNTLEDLFLHSIGTAFELEKWKRMEFPRLRRFRFDEADGFAFRDLFNKMTTPALEHLIIPLRVPDGRESIPFQQFIPLAIGLCQRSDISSHTLKQLSLWHVKFSESKHVETLLRALPALERIDISFGHHPHSGIKGLAGAINTVVSIFRRHTVDDEGKITLDICPKLKVLSLRSCVYAQIGRMDLDGLADMIQVRRPGANALAPGCLALESCSIGHAPEWNDDDPAERRLKKFKDEGMHIEMWCMWDPNPDDEEGLGVKELLL